MTVNAQRSFGQQVSATNEANLKALQTLATYTTAVAYDPRYQGVKGTPRLFDTLVSSTIVIRGAEEYVNIESDINVVQNSLLFIKSSGGELMEIKSDNIAELVFHHDGKDLVFKTTDSIVFDKKPDGNRFYQVLNESYPQFLKIPDKIFVKADYERAYGPDIRYDEFKPVSKYYIQGSDSVFYRVQLTRRSLRKLFPEKQQLINENFNEKLSVDPEADVIALLGKF
jgi:hypothetical protein